MKIICVVGARPNFVKIAPLMEAFAKRPEIDAFLTHTGQHYDERMSDLFFRELGIPRPDVNLGVGAGSRAVRTAETMKAFERVCLAEKPDAVLVVGDVDATLSCALVAVQLGIKSIHVEAGLRCGDRSTPEEINRVLVDSLSDLLFCTERKAAERLLATGKTPEQVFFVGNVMIDALLRNLEKAKRTTVLADLGLTPRRYAVATLHRPSSVDDPTVLAGILDAFDAIQRETPIVFPIHPRTRKNVEKFGLGERVAAMRNLLLVEPQGYLEFLNLNANAFVVLTDSGGLQEETTVLRTPCLTLRENTERPITCEVGTNRLVGVDRDAILAAFEDVKKGDFANARIPELWDGGAAERIADVLVERL